jgi:hypothetical protein
VRSAFTAATVTSQSVLLISILQCLDIRKHHANGRFGTTLDFSGIVNAPPLAIPDKPLFVRVAVSQIHTVVEH